MQEVLLAAVAEPPGALQVGGVHALEELGIGAGVEVEELADPPRDAAGFGMKQPEYVLACPSGRR